MQTRRDQLQAYRFQNRRALAALVTGEPNVVEAPMRRLTVTTLSGIMVAILVVAGFAVFGLIKPAPNDDWKATGAVIVTNETAAIFVRIGGVLHPVVNYASAVLAVTGSSSGSQIKVVHVDRAVLNGAKRGSTIGIEGLPTSLPSAAGLATAPFTVCSRTQAGDGTTLTTRVSVEIGDDVGSASLGANTGVVVHSAGADGADYLIAGGRRLTIAGDGVANSLRLNTSQALTVGTAFLDGIQAGTPLRTPSLTGIVGQTYPRPIAGRTVRVGQLLDDTDDHQVLLVLPDGVADLTDVEARLFETLPLPPGNTFSAPRKVSRSDIIGIPPSTRVWPVVARQFAGLPSTVPATSPRPAAQGGLCVLYRGGAGSATLAVPPSLLPSYSLPQVTQSASSARGLADRVAVSSGQAAVVRSNDHSTTTFLVAEPGLRYPAASIGVLAGFGYADVTPVTMPAQLLALIPVGRALSPTAARTPVSN